MKKEILKIVLLLALLLITSGVFAQRSRQNPPVSNPDYMGGVPFEGGISVLLVVGIGLGVKKLKESQKRKI